MCNLIKKFFNELFLFFFIIYYNEKMRGLAINNEWEVREPNKAETWTP